MIVTVALAASGFGIAGRVGTLLAAALCRGKRPFEDGPAPVDAPAWPFVAICACVGALVAAHGGAPLQLAGLALIAAALSACASADLRCGIVPDLCTLVPLVAVVGVGAWRHDPAPAVGAVFVAVPFAAAAVLSRGRGMGWGDVKLAALGGALLGARDATLAYFGACAAAYAWAMMRRRAAVPTAFAPYLVAALAIGLALRTH